MSFFFDEMAELKPTGRKITWFLVFSYSLALAFMCFTPQPNLFEGIQTPNVIYWGRLRLLLLPFNTILSFGQLDGPLEMIWVICQNLLNIFLLFPLLWGMLALFPSLRSWKRILLTAFCMSLFIECSQLILDLLFDANRVFEVDDLWTNTLGGAVAFISYKWISQKVRAKNKP